MQPVASTKLCAAVGTRQSHLPVVPRLSTLSGPAGAVPCHPGLGIVSAPGAEQHRGADSGGCRASASQGTPQEEQRGRGRLFIAAGAMAGSWCGGAGRLLAVTQQWGEGWEPALGWRQGCSWRAMLHQPGWLHSVEKAGIATARLCLFHLTTALGSSPQHPIAQLPSEPGKSLLLLSCPLGQEICSAHRFCFPDQFAAFHIDCCLFSHSACWWIWGFYC